MPENCSFCNIRDSGKVAFETREYFGNFDRFPVTPGHMEAVPKRHVVSFFELNDTEKEDYFKAMLRGLRTIAETDLRALYRRYIDEPLLIGRSVELCKTALAELDIGRERAGQTVGINDGLAAGRTVDHLHIHIIPRYFGDVPNPTGGVRHVIPERGYYK